ncbi:MAG: FRG domain-containing protein [Thermoguttaceae bacterium]|jgi:hypothetical protein
MEMVEIHDIDEFLRLAPSGCEYYAHFYRGEPSFFPYRTPAVWRLPIEDDRIAHNLMRSGVARLFFRREIGPHIKMEWGIPLHRGQWFGEYDLCNWANGVPSLDQISWQVVGLLQHYGYKTSYLDMTFDPTTALYFSCHDAAGKAISDGLGYVYHWQRGDVCRKLMERLILTSITRLSEFLRTEKHYSTSRPETQKAGSIWIAAGHEREDYIQDTLQRLNELATVYVIDRASIPPRFFASRDLFPQDAIPSAIAAATAEWVVELRYSIDQAHEEENTRLVEILSRARALVQCPTSATG